MIWHAIERKRPSVPHFVVRRRVFSAATCRSLIEEARNEWTSEDGGGRETDRRVKIWQVLPAPEITETLVKLFDTQRLI